MRREVIFTPGGAWRRLYSAPSTAHQATLDLHEKTPHSLKMEPPGLALHLWRPGMGLVTHVSYIGTYKGPEPFRTLQ